VRVEGARRRRGGFCDGGGVAKGLKVSGWTKRVREIGWARGEEQAAGRPKKRFKGMKEDG
jgi:hypothetical protein